MKDAGYSLVRVVNSLRLRSPQVPANDPHHTRDNSRLIVFGVRFQGVWNTPCRVSNPRSALHSTMRNHSLRQSSHQRWAERNEVPHLRTSAPVRNRFFGAAPLFQILVRNSGSAPAVLRSAPRTGRIVLHSMCLAESFPLVCYNFLYDQ